MFRIHKLNEKSNCSIMTCLSKTHTSTHYNLELKTQHSISKDDNVSSTPVKHLHSSAPHAMCIRKLFPQLSLGLEAAASIKGVANYALLPTRVTYPLCLPIVNIQLRRPSIYCQHHKHHSAEAADGLKRAPSKIHPFCRSNS